MMMIRLWPRQFTGRTQVTLIFILKSYLTREHQGLRAEWSEAKPRIRSQLSYYPLSNNASSVKITWPLSLYAKVWLQGGRKVLYWYALTYSSQLTLRIAYDPWRDVSLHDLCCDENYASKARILEAPRPLFLRRCSIRAVLTMRVPSHWV